MNEIDKKELDRIKIFSNASASELKNGNQEKLTKRLNPSIFKKSDMERVKGFLDVILKSLKNSQNFTIENVKIIDVGEGADLSVGLCGSVNPKNENYLKVSIPKNFNRVAYVFMNSNSSQLGYALSFMLNVTPSNIDVLSFSITNRSISGKSSKYYEHLAGTAEVNENYYTAFFSYSIATLLSNVNNFSSDSNFLRILDKRNVFGVNLSQSGQLRKIEIEGNVFSIVGLGIITTLNDISPHIKYVSHTDLNKKDVYKEARALLKYLINKEMDISKEFESILFEAYEKTPIEGARNKYYRVPLSTRVGF